MASLAAPATSVIASNSVSLMDSQLQQVGQVSATLVLDATVDSSIVGNGTVMGSSSSSVVPHLGLEASVGLVVASSLVNVHKSRVGKEHVSPMVSLAQPIVSTVLSKISSRLGPSAR